MIWIGTTSRLRGKATSKTALYLCRFPAFSAVLLITGKSSLRGIAPAFSKAPVRYQ